MQFHRLVLAILLSTCVTAGYADTNTGDGSSIRIKKISPPISQVLKPGEKINFLVELQYSLPVKSGRAGLIIQDKESNGAPLTTKFLKLSQGQGKASIQAEVVVPKTSTLQIFTPLYQDGGGSTSVVDSRVFEVTEQ